MILDAFGFHDRMGWWMLAGGIFWAIVVATTIYFAVRAISAAASRRDGPSNTSDDPLAIARRRYARGEITREEFEQICSDLARSPH